MLNDLQIRKLCDEDFFFFVRYMNRTPKDVAPISDHVHAELCDAYQDPTIHRGAIAMPRDWLKSTIFTKWGPIWRYLKDHEERILIAAENEKLAGRFLTWIERQILNNKRLRRIYPELLEVDRTYTKSNPWSKSECLLPREGEYSEPTFTAIGVQGAAQSGHYTTIQIDDLVGKKAAESILVLESVFRWFDNVNELLVQPHRTMPNPSKIWVIGTFWFPGDFLSYVRNNPKSQYRFHITPCRKAPDLKDEGLTRWVQNSDQPAGESNWPEQFPTEYYIDMLNDPEKEMVYWAQHMNMPDKSEKFTKFDIEWFRYWHFERDEEEGEGRIICLEDTSGKVIAKFPERDIVWRAFFDPGGFSEKAKMTKGDSRNAIVIGGQPYGTPFKIIRWAWAARLKTPDKLWDELFRAHAVCKPMTWRQEIFGQQEFILKDAKLEAQRRKIPFNIVPFDHDTRKDAKDRNIQNLIIPMFNGEIYIHRSFKDLIAETKEYPNGLTKDLLDMLAQLFRHYFTSGVKADPALENEAIHQAKWKKRKVGRTTGY